jgi:hypothetical protein
LLILSLTHHHTNPDADTDEDGGRKEEKSATPVLLL